MYFICSKNKKMTKLNVEMRFYEKQKQKNVFYTYAWNRLLPTLRLPDLSQNPFKQVLKTYLFSTSWHHWGFCVILAPDTNVQIYLLTNF